MHSVGPALDFVSRWGLFGCVSMVGAGILCCGSDAAEPSSGLTLPLNVVSFCDTENFADSGGRSFQELESRIRLQPMLSAEARIIQPQLFGCDGSSFVLAQCGNIAFQGFRHIVGFNRGGDAHKFNQLLDAW